MIYLWYGIGIVALFYALGRSADFVIQHVRHLGEKLGLRIFVLGVILGALTSLPELSVGASALLNNATELSFGNLFGGVIVLFGLVLGLSAILNRSIDTHGSIIRIFLVGCFVLIALGLGLDGHIGLIDGVLILIGYVVLVGFFFRVQKGPNLAVVTLSDRRSIGKHIIGALSGMVLIAVFSSLLIRLTLKLLESLGLSELATGIIVFSLGTNLPEIIVTVRSWRNNIRELALSNMMGSAMTNVAIIGLFGSIRPLAIVVDVQYWLLIAALASLFLVVIIFCRSGKRLVRAEGVVLLLLYLIFVIWQGLQVK